MRFRELFVFDLGLAFTRKSLIKAAVAALLAVGIAIPLLAQRPVRRYLRSTAHLSHFAELLLLIALLVAFALIVRLVAELRRAAAAGYTSGGNYLVPVDDEGWDEEEEVEAVDIEAPVEDQYAPVPQYAAQAWQGAVAEVVDNSEEGYEEEVVQTEYLAAVQTTVRPRQGVPPARRAIAVQRMTVSPLARPPRAGPAAEPAKALTQMRRPTLPVPPPPSRAAVPRPLPRPAGSSPARAVPAEDRRRGPPPGASPSRPAVPTRAPAPSTRAPAPTRPAAPTRSPVPTRSPMSAPMPARAPMPTRAPAPAPARTIVPVARAPTRAPARAPTRAPTTAPTTGPTRAPTRAPQVSREPLRTQAPSTRDAAPRMPSRMPLSTAAPRTAAPTRGAAPLRTAAPRAAAPMREAAPLRTAAPRTAAPMREAAPLRTAAPRIAAGPGGRAAVPQREAPARSAAPARAAAPARPMAPRASGAPSGSALGRTAGPGRAETRSPARPPAAQPARAVARAPRLAGMDEEVRWTGLLEVALTVLVERDGQRVSLEELVNEMRLSEADPRMRVLLARQLQDAGRANIVQIFRDAEEMPYYALTREGRMWAHGRLASEKLRRMTDRGRG